MKLLRYSRAQNFEDIMLDRVLADVSDGYYIDVGANDPVTDSVTFEFYASGWSGINIEPVDEFHQKLCSQRPRDINLKVCAGSIDDKDITLLKVAGTGLSTSSLSMKEEIEKDGFETEKVVVQTFRLDSIWKKHVKKDQVHFLKIDVEGMEKEVIKGIDLSKYRPWVIVIEAVSPIKLEPNHLEWQKMVTDQNYQFVYFDGLNRFYLAKEKNELKKRFKLPPNITDELFANVCLMRRYYSGVISESNHLKSEINRISDHFEAVNTVLKDENYSSLKEIKIFASEKIQLLEGLIKVQQQLHLSEMNLSKDKISLNEMESLVDELHSTCHTLNTRLIERGEQLDGILRSKLWIATYPYRRLRSSLRNVKSYIGSLDKKKTLSLVKKCRIELKNRGIIGFSSFLFNRYARGKKTNKIESLISEHEANTKKLFEGL